VPLKIIWIPWVPSKFFDSVFFAQTREKKGQSPYKEPRNQLTLSAQWKRLRRQAQSLGELSLQAHNFHVNAGPICTGNAMNSRDGLFGVQKIQI